MRVFLAAVTFMLFGGGAHAGSDGARPDEPKAATAESAGWQFSVSPYVWATGASGKAGQFNLPAARMTSSFGDIWHELDFAFMGAFEGRRDRYTVFGDLFYARMSDTDSNPQGHLRKDIDVTMKTFSGLIGGGYSLLANEHGNLDIVAGARVWSVSTRLSFDGGLLNGTKRRDSATWIDAVAGFRGTRFITDRFYVTGWATAGGGGAKLDWDLTGAVGYKIGDHFSVATGYRAMGVDYSHRGFIYDMVQRGPIVGLTYKF